MIRFFRLRLQPRQQPLVPREGCSLLLLPFSLRTAILILRTNATGWALGLVGQDPEDLIQLPQGG